MGKKEIKIGSLSVSIAAVANYHADGIRKKHKCDIRIRQRSEALHGLTGIKIKSPLGPLSYFWRLKEAAYLQPPIQSVQS